MSLAIRCNRRLTIYSTLQPKFYPSEYVNALHHTSGLCVRVSRACNLSVIIPNHAVYLPDFTTRNDLSAILHLYNPTDPATYL